MDGWTAMPWHVDDRSLLIRARAGCRPRYCDQHGRCMGNTLQIYDSASPPDGEVVAGFLPQGPHPNCLAPRSPRPLSPTKPEAGAAPSMLLLVHAKLLRTSTRSEREHATNPAASMVLSQ